MKIAISEKGRTEKALPVFFPARKTGTKSCTFNGHKVKNESDRDFLNENLADFTFSGYSETHRIPCR